MKRFISYIVSATVGCVFMASCADDDYTELNKGNDILTLTSSKTEVVLDEQEHGEDAFELAWTTGTNYGTGNRISYTLELAKAGTDFASPYKVIDGATQTYSWTPSVEELNNVLRNSFSVAGAETVSLEARVTATVTGSDEVQTSTTAFTVSTYKPAPATLYIIGSAMPNGWDAGKAEEMKRSDNGIFTYSGVMHVGEYKFITTLGEFYPQYVDNGNGVPVLRTGDDDPVQDKNFEITEEAADGYKYQIDVNLLTGTLTVKQVLANKARFDQLFFVGDDNSWGFDPMTVDPLDQYLFRIGRVFNAKGEFKFGTASGSWENMYKALNANASYTDTGMEFISGYDPDNKWYLNEDEAGKAYKICVDIREGKERMLMTEFTPYEMIYLVGDATPNGWDLGNATPMTVSDSDPYTLTWTGTLNTGELKFSCDKDDSWNGAWFMSAESGAAPTGDTEQMLFIDKSSDYCKSQYLDINVGDVDNKWKIQEAGTYTITLNQLTETISIVKK